MINGILQFDEVKKRAEAAVRTAFPIQSNNHALEVSNLRWLNVGDDVRDDIAAQKEAKLKMKTFAAKLIGNVTLKDTSGKTVDAKKDFVLLLLPHITARASYIVDGNEVQTVNQLRLRPGPYTRYTIDNNTETFINAAGGGYRIIFNRETGVFRLKSGQTAVYLFPVLKAVGVSDQQMQQAWGTDIYAANKKYEKADSPVKLFRNMRRYAATIRDPATIPAAELAANIQEFFESKKLEPSISKLTLGEAYDRITIPLLIKASQKALALSRNEVEEDDTESLAYKSVFSVEDFIEEKLNHTVAFLKKILPKTIDRTPSINMVLTPMTLSGPVLDWFRRSEFTRYSDQLNPIDMASTAQLTTLMGEGGIQSEFAVSDRVRDAHPSQIGFIDPVHTPEGSRVGVTGHFTIGVMKKGDKIFTTLVDAKTGKNVDMSPDEIENYVVAFPDQYIMAEGKKPRPIAAEVKARSEGRIQLVPVVKVQYLYKDVKGFFSAASNAIPFMHTNHATRSMMADRHMEQAVPLVNPEAPLVQSRFSEGVGYEQVFGENANVRSSVSGKVTRVSPSHINIKDAAGKDHQISLHDRYPLNGGVFLTDTATVKAGDAVKKGQVLANNNFSKDKTLAIGTNLITAILPWYGWNYEDGYVVSETAAHKLTSEHMHDILLEKTTDTVIGLNRWLAHFPGKAETVDKAKYDQDGVIKKGVSIGPGEVIIPAVEQMHPHEEYDYARLHKAFAAPWRDASEVWDGTTKAEVVEVVKAPKFVRVQLRTEEPLVVGDKLSVRAGGKGIVASVLPDNEMPHTKDGKAVEVLYNPAGIAGRNIPGLMFEGSAAKIAAKTGKTYLARNFDTSVAVDENLRDELRKNGLSDTEDLHDPGANRTLKNIFVGPLHVMKLQHQVRKKFSAKGFGSYTVDSLPTKIDHESAQNIGVQEIYALLAAGSLHFLQDSTKLKGSSNPEYWRALQNGLPTPPPQQPFILDKFVTYLAGAGINLKQEGSRFKALPVTDKDVEQWARGEIENPGVVRASDLLPEPGGLFDKAITGGIGGTAWSMITLESSVPNPLMEKAIISLTGLKASEYAGIMNGSLYVTKDGRFVTDAAQGKSHGEGLRILLARIDVNKELAEIIPRVNKSRGSMLDTLNKKRRYLQALKAMKMSPVDAYIQTKVPVIPPAFRPIYPLPNGSLNVADANHTYREVLLINNQIKDLKKIGVDDKNLARLRTDLYGAVQGVVGLTEPLTRGADFKGFIAQIKGRENKSGMFQGKMVRRPQDLSGRSTVIPVPHLGIDTIGIPIDMGMVIYKPFLVRRLVNMGHTPNEANDLIDKKDPAALRALNDEMEFRPVYMNRAPTLHRFNLMAFKPVAVEGKAIHVNPLIVKGYAMDFDGDTAGIHVPVSEESRREAFDKIPSRQILATTSSRLMHTPSAETALGLYMMTVPKGIPVKAKSITEMLNLFQKKTIEVNAAVDIGGKTWTPGQALLDALFPADVKPGNVLFTKGTMDDVLYKAARKHPKEIGDIVSKVKDLGNHYVTHLGFSWGLSDLMINRKERDRIMEDAAKKTKKVGFDVAYAEAADKIGKLVSGSTDSRVVLGNITSGAFGKSAQVAQMLGAPVAVVDHKGRSVRVPIGRNYAEGLDIGSYWATLPGARHGMIQKGLGTQKTGALAKRLLNTTSGLVISEHDCGTTNGLAIMVDSRDALDRIVAEGAYKGKIVTTELVRSLVGKNVKVLKLRSPLTCQSVRGLCAKCYGLLENGQLPPVGYHIGVLAGQAVSEPVTQLMLRQFHTQGVVGQAAMGFDRVAQLYEMPDNVRGSAVLAKASGKITDVKPSAAGGWFVHMGSMEHYLPSEVGIAVKKGDTVRAGQKLSERGIIKPQEMLGATGDIHRVREQILNDLDDAYRGGNLNVRRKLFETVVKPMTDRAEVMDSGDGEKHGIFKGDVVSINQVDAINRDIKKAKGSPIRYEATLLPIRVAPFHSDDFIGKLMFERPHETLSNAPGLGVTADSKSGHPITQHVFGGYVMKEKK